MDSNTCLYYLRLVESHKFPDAMISKLLKEFGSSKALIELPRSRLRELGFDSPQIDLLQDRHSEIDSQRNVQVALEWACKDQNHLVGFESRHYPPLLREIDAAPPLLFVKGSLSALQGPHFSFVGSRRATIYGKRNAYWLAQELSKAGLQICSGMANGIDSKAHEGCLDSGFKTLAVIGTGIDRVYPSSNVKLAERIIENGALVSEFPLGTPPFSRNFPRRNRVISGLSLGTLVVEANLKSGSLITARLAMEQNRDVFAVPGPIANPQSRGCHFLVKLGAKLVEDPVDVLEELNFFDESPKIATDPKAQAANRANTSELVALKAIDHQGCLFQAIKDECGLPIQELNTQLIQLEVAGLIRQEGGRYFRVDSRFLA